MTEQSIMERVVRAIEGSCDVRIQARAAIEAMREPTQRMLFDGATAINDAHEEIQDSFETYIITHGSDYALPGWHAMIDAALDEK